MLLFWLATGIIATAGEAEPEVWTTITPASGTWTDEPSTTTIWVETAPADGDWT